ncbi:hypothetical protein ABZ714_18975 [Streptomyces sp. NPDC006798]|uniref:hypothetical protein n=1 Tax=Streptomyces sp. NPDC006798 TaxID=3155462 RepID=UPI0033F08B05
MLAPRARSARSVGLPHAGPARDTVGSRLPWWGIALPVLAFALLFVLIAEPARADSPTGQPLIAPMVEYLRQFISR